MMGWYGSGMSGGLWVFMGLFWVVLIAAIIWLVVRLLPSNARSGVTPAASAGSGSSGSPLPSPLEVLDRRLAHGEIDLETYQAHRAALVAARGGK